MACKSASSSPQWATILYLLLVFICPLALIGCVRGQGQAPSQDVSSYGTVIGIDLGTTYSCVGVMQNGRVEIVPNDQGNRVTPSYVAFTENERLIGDAAKNQLAANPQRTIFDMKRLIGRRFADTDVQADAKHFPFSVSAKDGKPTVNVEVSGSYKYFSPEEISAMVLGKMKETAESYLDKKVTHAVVTVPAYFNDNQRQATKDAGTIAGLNVLRVINEPTAAALAYGLNKTETESQILVYDLGGGTFDVSLLAMDHGVFEVLATAGDTHLGGEDFDQRVIQHFTKLYNQKHGFDVARDHEAIGKLKQEVENAKRTLSTHMVAHIEIEDFHAGNAFSDTLTRAKFEELNDHLFKRTLKPVEQVLRDAKLKKAEIDEIILVGGSTRIPKVRSIIEEYFEGKNVNTGINPDEAVAYGAAILGGILSHEEGAKGIGVQDVNSLTLGIETSGGVMTTLIPRNSKIPTKQSKIFSTTNDDQLAVLIKVLEGERPLSMGNNVLGQFELNGIPPAPRGKPQIEVSFQIDSNGILRVSASDRGTGNSETVTITSDRNRLSQKDIDRMVADAETFAEEDQAARARIEARNQLETLTFNLRNQVSDGAGIGGIIGDEDKQCLVEAMKEAIDWLEQYAQSATAEEIDGRREILSDVAHMVTNNLYDGTVHASAYWNNGATDGHYEL